MPKVINGFALDTNMNLGIAINAVVAHPALVPHPALVTKLNRAITRALIGGVGCLFIYSHSARQVSFEIRYRNTKLIYMYVSHIHNMAIHPYRKFILYCALP